MSSIVYILLLIKSGPDIILVYELGHWVIGSTNGSPVERTTSLNIN